MMQHFFEYLHKFRASTSSRWIIREFDIKNATPVVKYTALFLVLMPPFLFGWARYEAIMQALAVLSK